MYDEETHTRCCSVVGECRIYPRSIGRRRCVAREANGQLLPGTCALDGKARSAQSHGVLAGALVTDVMALRAMAGRRRLCGRSSCRDAPRESGGRSYPWREITSASSCWTLSSHRKLTSDICG